MDLHTGIEFGRVLERVDSLVIRITRVEEEIKRVRYLLTRAGLVVLIWIAGLSAKLPAETIGDFTASFLKGLLK
jgi:hypothetical protein